MTRTRARTGDGRCRGRPVAVLLALGATLALTAAACGGDDTPATGNGGGAAEEPSGTLRVYTSVTQETVDAVVDAFSEENPGVEFDVFRAPTGQLDTRIQTEERQEGIRADVLWLTDPLSMFGYDEQGLLLGDWRPDGADAVPEEFQSENFWGTRVLHMVAVHHEDVRPPARWGDLTAEDYGQVAIPDPGFAGSAFGALGYFALSEDFGFGFYRGLAAAGGTQVQSPGEVVTGVAQGRFDAGMTLDFTVRNAIEDGSPVERAWPEPGAVAMYSPIGVVDGADEQELAQSFTEFVLTEPAQEAIADTGWEPTLPDVEGPEPPEGAQTVTPDWPAAFERQDELLDEYNASFGG